MWIATVLVALGAAVYAVPLSADPPGVTYAPALQQQLHTALKARGPGYQPRTRHFNADGSPTFTNRLIQEDSPYLLQHAHNPVNWYAWGPEAFARAKRENKPVFLSIGYSTCHWCHVMERESFEDLEVARFLNTHFIAIKVDRERRPDVDNLYMTAVQITTGRGGWPMSSMLTPDGKTFFGGTYFPRDRFLEILHKVADLWKSDRAGLQAQAERIAQAVRATTRTAKAAGQVGDGAVKAAVSALLARHDDLQGGLGQAPKFPNEPKYLLLLDTALRHPDKKVIDLIDFDLDAMARGGIYDQVGGGFHRYSTDNAWLVPHFEKMLYNQAQLARVYVQAWRLTGNAGFARTARQTLDYVLRDMRSPEGGFYSATDADSDGREGRFFLWTPAQIRAALPADDARLAIELFGVTEAGNFDGSNILHLPLPLAEVARQHHLSLPKLLNRVDRIRQRLYQVREQRVHPGRDEKILTAWNGMMITALAEAAELLDDARYQQAAVRAADFLWQVNRRDNDRLWRARLHDRSSVAASQEDYAWLAEACIRLYDLTQQDRWLERAQALVKTMNTLFWDTQAGGYFMNTAGGDTPVMARPKDDTDGAVPAANAVALDVLARLFRRTGETAYETRAEALLAAFAGSINDNPAAYTTLLRAARQLTAGDAGSLQYAARGAIRVDARAHANRLSVKLAIRPGWHINAHMPLQKELIPTSLSLDASGKKDWRLGQIGWPEPVLKTLGFQSEKLALYEGQVQLAARLTPALAKSPGPLIPIRLHLQACNDRLCLPPEEHLLQVAVTATTTPVSGQKQAGQ